MKKLISVVGARPNFMKMAPVHKALSVYKNEFVHLICHTGQHFDQDMSDIFFRELSIPNPHFNLGINSGSHATQTSGVMIGFERICQIESPDLVLVYGDVNSTMACSIVAKKLSITVAHVESGLRSFDRSMPEEINRIITDSISDFFFVTEESGVKNLLKEGIPQGRIQLVGNTMIDTLIDSLPHIQKSPILEQLYINPKRYILSTFHRPSNVDNPEMLGKTISFLNKISDYYSIIFPLHPRSRKNIQLFGLQNELSTQILLLDPLGYHDFIHLVKNASLVITDSGGIQEETTFLNVPCLTLRTSTERPITVDLGTNILCGNDFSYAFNQAKLIFSGNCKKGVIPDYWDGKAAERICNFLRKKLI